METTNSAMIAQLTADVVSAFISNNQLNPGELPKLIHDVHQALVAAPAASAPAPPLVPAIPIKKSVGPEFIVCLEDGKKFKSMKRHIRNEHGLSPAEYRIKWGLPPDYPMVASNYAAARSQLAKSMGLGTKRNVATKAAKPTKKRAPQKRPAAAS